ncbi:MAG: sigma-54 interaction domain-containing protein [Eubacterium sp.]|jgi:PAS domain S-box-containing protein
MDIRDSEKYKTLLSKLFCMSAEQMPVMLIADRDGRYVYVNKGWEENLGHSLSEVYGKKVTDVVPESQVDNVLATGESAIGYIVKGVNDVTLFNNCFPLRENGKIIGCAVVTFFLNMNDAMVFSKSLEEMAFKLNYYKEELTKLRGAKYHLDEIIGSSHAIKNLKQEIYEASKTNSTVLIYGETGTGKELVANSIHDLSPRSAFPFIKINCAAIPSELVESELFGYEAGSFTNAKKSGKIGLFEAADKGSLLLDEINQMDYSVQPKLLRVLQEKEIQHIGSNKSIPVDTRIIATTNTSLWDMVAAGSFREDLFYRLNVVSITIPPLRDHLEDIPELVEHARVKLNRDLGTHVSGFTDKVIENLMNYPWPGNVRELNNALERAMNTQMSGTIGWDAFSGFFDAKRAHLNIDRPQRSLLENRNEAEKSLILKELITNKYNKSKTAKALGISRTLLYQKLKKYDIE